MMLDMAPAIIPGPKILKGSAIPFIPKIQAYTDSGVTDASMVSGMVSIKVRLRYPTVIERRSDGEDAAATSVLTIGANARAMVQTASTP